MRDGWWALWIAIAYSAVVTLWGGPGATADYVWLLLSYLATILSLTVCALALSLAVRTWRHGLTIPRPVAGAACSAMQPLVIFAVTMAGFTTFKTRILPLAGFDFGPTIATNERWLLGTDAWRITHALLPSIWTTQLIDLAYHSWFAPMALGMVLCAIAPRNSAVVQRYMLAFVLVWIIEGSLIAYRFPAAGPCFYDFFQLDHQRFAQLGVHLQQQNAALRAVGMPGVAALDYQAGLYRDYVAHRTTFGGGISAMPSLHNATAILFACAAFHWSRRAGWLFAGYAVVIWVGSIHLGWHYAFDGVIALAATMAIWKFTGVVVHASHRPIAAVGSLQPAFVRAPRSRRVRTKI